MTPTETTEQENAAELQPSVEAANDQNQPQDGTGEALASHPHTHAAQPTMNPELVREISVEVDADTVSKAFRNVTKKYGKLARIPGFRVGRVPETVIKNRFQKEVRQEVLDELVSARFQQALQEQNIQPVSQPQLTNLMLVDGQPLQFKAAFEVLPQINVDGYDAITVDKPETTLTDAEFDAEVARVMDQHGTVEPVEEDRELVDGDWAEIEFTGHIQPLATTVGEDAEELEEITGEDVLIEVGGANTLPAFSDALRGQKPGQEMDFEVTYPDNFGEPRLAGQTVKYDVKLKSIKKKTFPEKDEEFAKQLGNYESWSDFETKLREMANGRKQDQLLNGARDKMLTELSTLR